MSIVLLGNTDCGKIDPIGGMHLDGGSTDELRVLLGTLRFELPCVQ